MCYPCRMNSGLSIQQFIAFEGGLRVLVSFFHQKFWIPSIPGADQFFLFFSMCCSFSMSTVISSTCVTLSFILLAAVCIHFILVFLCRLPIFHPRKSRIDQCLEPFLCTLSYQLYFWKSYLRLLQTFDCYVFVRLWSMFWSILLSTFADSLPISLWHLLNSLRIWVDSQLLFLTTLVFFSLSVLLFFTFFCGISRLQFAQPLFFCLLAVSVFSRPFYFHLFCYFFGNLFSLFPYVLECSYPLYTLHL